MVDFLYIANRQVKDGIEIFPKFQIKKSKDLMIRGGDFYAIWIEKMNIWSTDEQDAIELIDNELRLEKKRIVKKYPDANIIVKYMWDSDSGAIDRWHKYCQKQSRDNYHMLDETLIFSNTETTKESYSTKRLPYPLEDGDISAWNEIMSVLYDKEERHKIEWTIGSIVSGDSKKIQKFMVLYGAAGTGKSTVLNIIQQLFDGYYNVFDAKALGSSSSQFALEAFKSNPLVAIQHDGDLSKIEDNTRLNSLVSHELMTINEKFKATYASRFNAFLFMGTNRPVKITDGKSGLLRRLIDVTPTGRKIPTNRYKSLMKKIDFELGHIAKHCLDIYLKNPGYYDSYVPIAMMGASNDFYNFVEDNYRLFTKESGITLKSAYMLYKEYCESAKVPYPNSQRVFREELKNYFWNFDERFVLEDGTVNRNWYSRFKKEIFEAHKTEEEESDKHKLIEFQDAAESTFDINCAGCLAQYASKAETPLKPWDKVTSTLNQLNTKRLHYVKVPENHIVIDFDIPDENGNKSFEKNLEEASKWPETYAELSKSGGGIHLHYIYTGNISKLSRVYAEHIEIKVYTGKSSLRRKLTKCNNLPIATIGSGLPLRGDKEMINFESILSEKALRTIIKKNLNKEYHGYTKPSVNFIKKILDDAYNDGLRYDVTDLRNAVLGFAANSSNNAEECIKTVNNMKFKSEENSKYTSSEDDRLVFFDTEVFPNLFMVCWMYDNDDADVVTMINPKPHEIEQLLKYKLVGFNNKSYDNSMIYACMMGYTNEELYRLSSRLVDKDKDISRRAKFREAYHLSYTDIYDFASAGNKKSLKKLEIEMGITHQELGLPWDQPVPEDKWTLVADYCCNDVRATRAAFYYLKGDWTARQILADITGMSVNDSTNDLSARAIFGNNRNPQDEFNWRDLSKPVSSDQYEEYRHKFGSDYQFRVFDENGFPQYRDYIPGEILPKGWSILPFFKGYIFDSFASNDKKSFYMGEYIGEGGRVCTEPGMYGNVWDADVTGMHPSTAIVEVIFGPRYTKAFKQIFDGRVSIKHQAWDEIDHLFDGKLKPYIQKVIDGQLTYKELANALKTVVNAVYGLTSAKFPNIFKSPENIDNLVAKRGALFMTLLKSEVQKRGFTVCHIKTDSIKIPDATEEIKEFVIRFGKEFGYSFETEAEFEKFLLKDKANYVAKHKDGHWSATGDYFSTPYVFKKLFTKEPIEFEDLCEIKSTRVGALYLDMNEQSEHKITEDEMELKGVRRELNKILRKEPESLDKIEDLENGIDSLCQQIEESHNYIFIGRVGQFCPIKPGRNGGNLYYKNDTGKYLAVSGTKGYRWLESELVKRLHREDDIDLSYYDTLVNDAAETISFYGDLEWFVSDDPYIGPSYDEDDKPDYVNY